MNGKIISFSVLALAFIVGGVGVTSAYNNVGRQDLTDEQKTVLDQMHDLRMNGDFEGADALREKAGLPERGMGRGNSMMNENREAVRTAIENNDFTAFKEATKDHPMMNDVTAETFAKMVEAHKLMDSGDFEGGRAIMDELGIGRPAKGMGNRGNCLGQNQ